jgi:hypothetical protein
MCCVLDTQELAEGLNSHVHEGAIDAGSISWGSDRSVFSQLIVNICASRPRMVPSPTADHSEGLPVRSAPEARSNADRWSSSGLSRHAKRMGRADRNFEGRSGGSGAELQFRGRSSMDQEYVVQMTENTTTLWLIRGAPPRSRHCRNTGIQGARLC